MDRMIEGDAETDGTSVGGTAAGTKIRVSIVAAPDIEPSVAIGVHDALWAVGTLWNRVMGETEAPRFAPEIVAAGLGTLTTSTGVKIQPHRRFSDDIRTDIIFIPSLLIRSGAQFGRENPDLLDWVKRAYAAGRMWSRPAAARSCWPKPGCSTTAMRLRIGPSST